MKIFTSFTMRRTGTIALCLAAVTMFPACGSAMIEQ